MERTSQLAEKVMQRNAEALLVAQGTEWISVSDECPKEGVRCIIALIVSSRYVFGGESTEDYRIELGEWHGDRWQALSVPGKTTLHPSMVRHWMPLPEPPEQP